MITKVEVRTDQGDLLALQIFDPAEGLLIKDIQGLDPVDAVLGYSSMAGQDDEQEQSSKRVKRNIVLVLDYQPDFVNSTVKKLRDHLYSFFMPKKQVRLRFFSDDMPTVEIVGRVEKFNSPLFVQDPEATISLICAKSSFVGLDTLSFNGNTTSGAVPVDRQYDGSIETGFAFRLTANRAMDGFSIVNQLPDGSLQNMQIAFSILNGDIIDINTVTLQKSVRLTRGGVSQSILYAKAPTSPWVNLYPGVNKIRVVASGAAVPFSITYANKYGGL